jgi:enoyl-CoA hydratase/carnithine racemase
MGLINRVFTAAKFDDDLRIFLEELLNKSGAVMRVALKGLRELSLQGFDRALKRSEDIYCRELLDTEDVQEGVRAFLEKRPPNWRHR